MYVFDPAGSRLPKIAGVILLLFVAGVFPWSRLLPNNPPGLDSTERRIERPEVLVVSLDARDRFSVTATVEPRGYHVVVAPTVQAGLERLRKGCKQIGMVVLDTALPNSRQIVTAVKSGCPVYLVPLAGRRRPAQVAQLVMPGLI